MIVAAVATLTLVAGSPAAAPPPGAPEEALFALLEDDLDLRPIWLAVIDDENVWTREADGVVSTPRTECVGLTSDARIRRWAANAWLRLADGQIFPGAAATGVAPDGDRQVVAWDHQRLGLLAVPLDRIASITYRNDIAPPEAKDADVVLLANGDRLEGFVLSLADPVLVEVETADGPDVVEAPLELVAAVTILNPASPPQGHRVWLSDGAVIDVDDIALRDDGGVILTGASFRVQNRDREVRLDLAQLRGVRFAGAVTRALAAVPPRGVDGPPTRFRIPDPVVGDPNAPLGLADVELRGPVTVRYPLDGAARFAATAVMPLLSRDWGDCELIILDDDREVFRRRINAAQPTAQINVELTGSELTIRIEDSAFGPVQDHIVLQRARLGG